MYTTRLAPRRHSIVDTKTPHYYVFDLSNVASCIGVLILGLSRLVLWDNTIAMITWTNSRSRNSNKCNFHYVCAPGCAWLFILKFQIESIEYPSDSTSYTSGDLLADGGVSGSAVATTRPFDTWSHRSSSGLGSESEELVSDHQARGMTPFNSFTLNITHSSSP